MEKTVITQNKTQILTAPETYEYKIETSVTEKGELPFIQIFVYTIIDATDPTLDIFARVATPGDLDGTTALKTGRDAAILAGVDEFLSSYFSVQYADLTIAIQALSAITTRINDLINNWIMYRDQFMLNDGIGQYFPTTDPEFEQALKDAYTSAKQSRVAAEQDVLETATELTLAEKDAANAQTIYEIYAKEREFCQKTHLVDWAALDVALTALINGGDSFATDSKTSFCSLAGLSLGTTITWPLPSPDETKVALATSGTSAIPSLVWGQWYDAIVAFDNVKTAYASNGAPARVAVGADLQSFCLLVTGNYTTSYNTKVAAESAVSDAVLNKKEAEAELVAAQAAEEAALARVMEVCPTFDPASV